MNLTSFENLNLAKNLNFSLKFKQNLCLCLEFGLNLRLNSAQKANLKLNFAPLTPKKRTNLKEQMEKKCFTQPRF